MKSPFITLRKTRNGRTVSININNICHVEDQTYSDSQGRCTYISLNSPGVTTIHVRENYEYVMSLINEYYGQ
jgi:hypothetical protein